MAGLLDLYGSALTPDQTQALQQRGLLGFLGGMQKSGALDYALPFGMGHLGGLAAGLAGGAGGMGEAQDAGALNAMRAQQLGLQAQMTRAQIGALTQEGLIASHLYGQGGAPSAAGPSTTGPGPAAAPAGEASTGLLPTLVKQAESNGDYNIGFGGADLSNAPRREDGFPIWEGKVGPAGISHAAGAYQFEPATWAQYAGPLGIKDFSQGSQDKVFQAAVADQGLRPWMANPKIAALVRTGQFGGSGSSMPPQPGLIAAAAIPGSNPRTGGVPMGTPGAAAPISVAAAAAQNAQLRAAGTPALPTMPSNYIFGKGLVAPPGAGTVGGGLLPQPAASAPPGAPGTPFAQVTGQQPPAASPMPQAAPAAPGGMMPGGAMMPGGINPQAAQALAFLRTSRGAPVPDFVNQAAGMPFVGPKAYAEANAKGQVELQNAGPLARQKSLNTFEKLGPGETLYDPLKGVITQTPKLPEFNPNAARDAFNRPMPGIVTFGANGGTVTPTQGGGIAGATAPGAAGSATGNAMLTPGQIKQNEVQGEANVKRSEALYDGIQQQSTQFQRDMNPYLQLSKSILNTPGMYSGAGGQWSLDFNRVKAALGDTNAAMMQEALGKVTAQSVLSQINNQRAQMQESGSNSSRIFSSQVELVEKAAPAMTTTIGGNRFLVNVAERMGTLSNTVAEMAREYKMQHGILDTGFDKQLSDYMKANPVFTKQELEHPQILGAPNVPPSIQSPEQLNAWAASMGVKKGDPIRLDDGSVRKLP